jgi:hypothetical protein
MFLSPPCTAALPCNPSLFQQQQHPALSSSVLHLLYQTAKLGALLINGSPEKGKKTLTEGRRLLLFCSRTKGFQVIDDADIGQLCQSNMFP